MQCTNFLNCDNGKLNTEGAYLVDLRDNLNNDCSQLLDVCCDSPDVQNTPIAITMPPISGKCGLSNPNGIVIKIKKIIDHEAEFGEFPWMVAVLKKENIFGKDSNVYHCGGSLIHP